MSRRDHMLGWPPALDCIDAPTEYPKPGHTVSRFERLTEEQEKERAEDDLRSMRRLSPPTAPSVVRVKMARWRLHSISLVADPDVDTVIRATLAQKVKAQRALVSGQAAHGAAELALALRAAGTSSDEVSASLAKLRIVFSAFRNGRIIDVPGGRGNRDFTIDELRQIVLDFIGPARSDRRPKLKGFLADTFGAENILQLLPAQRSALVMWMEEEACHEAVPATIRVEVYGSGGGGAGTSDTAAHGSSGGYSNAEASVRGWVAPKPGELVWSTTNPEVSGWYVANAGPVGATAPEQSDRIGKFLRYFNGHWWSCALPIDKARRRYSITGYMKRRPVPSSAITYWLRPATQAEILGTDSTTVDELVNEECKEAS